VLRAALCLQLPPETPARAGIFLEAFFMLRAAIGFFVLALVAILLGANNIAGVSMEVGRMLLFVFLVLAVISFVVSLVGGRGGRKNIL
jgi:uncharacterized membrane protein YtjA (UPF0391 family)